MIFAYALATISIGSELQEEVTFQRCNDGKDVVRPVSSCWLEHSPYRQLHLLWCLQGLWQNMRGDHEWKPLKRRGLASRGAEWPAEKMMT